MPGGRDARPRSTRRRPVRSILADVDRDQIIRALKEADGRVGGPDGAASRLGLNRTTFITRMNKLGIYPNTVSECDVAVTDTPATSDAPPAQAFPPSQIPQNKHLADKLCPLSVWHWPCLIQKREKQTHGAEVRIQSCSKEMNHNDNTENIHHRCPHRFLQRFLNSVLMPTSWIRLRSSLSISRSRSRDFSRSNRPDGPSRVSRDLAERDRMQCAIIIAQARERENPQRSP